MELYKTGNPVPSADMRDIFDDNRVWDLLINGKELEVVLRTGGSSITWRGIEKRTDDKVSELTNIITSLDVSGFTFTDITTGINATTNGQFFRTPQGLNSEYAFFYYQNNAGEAKLVARLISNEYVEARLPSISSPNFRIPLFVDETGNVPVWLDGGKLSASGISDNIRDVVDTNYPQKIPLFVDEAGNVPLWLENGKLGAVELSDDLKDSVNAGITDKVPLFVDEEGNVPVWLEEGKLNAVALHDNLTDGLITEEVISKIILQRTLKTSGETAWKYRSKKAKLELGLSSKIKIGFTGDSWTEHSTIPQVFADYFYQKYGKAGDGWIQLNIDNPNQLNGIVLQRSGWSVYDASATSSAPAYPTAMDGQYIYATGTAATLSVSNLFCSSVQLFYYDGDGAFRYSINGGNPVVITGAGTNRIVSVNITGLDISTSTTLSVDLTGNTGGVAIYGLYANGAGNGVEISKMGNGGITAPQYIKTLPYLSQTGAVVAPDVLIMIIGTNDFRTNVTLQEFRDGLTWWLNAWKAVIPDSAIVLVAPAQCNANGANPLTNYRDIMRDVAINAGVEFFSLYDFMSADYSKANSEGVWKDNLHLSNIGARSLLNNINKFFLE